MAPRAPLDLSRVLIVQPYIPAYRVPLFAAMRAELREHGVELAIAAARAGGADSSRGDDTTTAAADILLGERRISVGSKSLLLRHVGQAIDDFRPGYVVVEQAIKNLETWPLLLKRGGATRPSVGLWGQGRSYSTAQSAMEARAKQWLTRRADWFFAYTQAGVDHVIASGFPRARTTVLQNSTDTRALRQHLADVTQADLDDFRVANGLTPGRTALFLGGVDARKGISFVLEAAGEIARQLPGFTLLVAGSGESAGEVEHAQEQGGPVRYLGRVDGRDKAMVLAVADVLMIPEWVGLVAVDSLASGTPIVTTRHPSHSPEVEYLVDGLTAVIADHDVTQYAAAVAALLTDPVRHEAMTTRCLAAADDFSIEQMAHRFTVGIGDWMRLT